MKKITLIIITLAIFMTAFSGCADIRYKELLSCTYYGDEKNGLVETRIIDFTEETSNKLTAIINNCKWEGVTDTVHGDFVFEFKNATVTYHSKMGILVDQTNGRQADLDLYTRAKLHKMFGATKSRVMRIYRAPIYSFDMAASSVPEIKIEDGVIYTITEGTKERLGTVSKININMFNFDFYIKKYEDFDRTNIASVLRKENKIAYKVNYDAAPNGIALYYIMEQKNGETLIVYGHYDYGKKGNEIRFIYMVVADDKK